MIDCRNIDPEEWRGFSRKNGDTVLLAGPPCQDLSIGSKTRQGLDGPRSWLAKPAIALIKKLQPDWWIVENVASMKKDQKDIFTELLGVEPIEINSNLVSAQNRRRLYWTNIPYAGPPKDRGVMLKHILETNVDPKYLAGQKLLDNYAGGNQLNPDYKSQANTIHDHTKKSPCIAAGTHGYAIGYVDAEHFKYGDMDEVFTKEPKLSRDGLCHVGNANLNGHGYLKRVYDQEGKAPTLTTNGGGNREPKVFVSPKKWRKLTPLECERLQTLPDNYTNHVSNTQRYKMIGNGFTVDVIAHILSGIPDGVTIQRVYSLFDGCSMGQVALHRAMSGHYVYSSGKQDLLAPDYRYFSSEIDKYAMKVTQANWNATVQMGDIKDLSLYKIIKERWY